MAEVNRQRSDGLIVHFVNDQITFMERSRQRCMWCGALIEDKDWKTIVIPTPEGKTAEQAKKEAMDGTWGGYVARDPTGWVFAVAPEIPGEPPLGSCFWMNPEAIG